MRAVFQSQPDVSHVYLGSRRSLMAELFNDVNEPFWRSAKHIELGPIPVDAFASFVDGALRRHREEGAARGRRRGARDNARPPVRNAGALLRALGGDARARAPPTTRDCDAAMERVLRSENAYFTHVWDGASRTQRARAPGARRRAGRRGHEQRSTGAGTGCPTGSSVHRALDALVEDELVAREGPGRYRIVEPFLAEWIRRYGA